MRMPPRAVTAPRPPRDLNPPPTDGSRPGGSKIFQWQFPAESLDEPDAVMAPRGRRDLDPRPRGEGRRTRDDLAEAIQYDSTPPLSRRIPTRRLSLHCTVGFLYLIPTFFERMPDAVLSSNTPQRLNAPRSCCTLAMPPCDAQRHGGIAWVQRSFTSQDGEVF